ncbi:hypothetical protein BGZ65_007866 [Modicella reniformis]|uniref:Uncharacterized protein n=1 Tax=Modicella reniformis TaxID=1440133 RepID=A0A9P6IJC9_9FUNG|nr:hypothetical protein BGZ65_007866 [Modicella reniformis]
MTPPTIPRRPSPRQILSELQQQQQPLLLPPPPQQQQQQQQPKPKPSKPPSRLEQLDQFDLLEGLGLPGQLEQQHQHQQPKRADLREQLKQSNPLEQLEQVNPEDWLDRSNPLEQIELDLEKQVEEKAPKRLDPLENLDLLDQQQSVHTQQEQPKQPKRSKQLIQQDLLELKGERKEHKKEHRKEHKKELKKGLKEVSEASESAPSQPQKQASQSLSSEEEDEQQEDEQQQNAVALPAAATTAVEEVAPSPPPSLTKDDKQDSVQNLTSRTLPEAAAALTAYPPPPPLILYSDDQITISSLHLTIHAFYFPLNTPMTISLLSITEIETLPSSRGSSGGNSGGMIAGWLNYKNWAMSAALPDVWWARDPRRSANGTFTPSSMIPFSFRSGENTASVHLIVRVKGEWLRKGFGVQDERCVKVLQEAWKHVRDSQRGLRSLQPAAAITDSESLGDCEEDGFEVDGSTGESTNGGAEKRRRWMNHPSHHHHQNNTWTAYPFPDDSPLYLAQQQRRGATSLLSSKVSRYHRPQRAKPTSAMTGDTAVLREDESCGDDPLFVDNDLNIYDEI